MAENPLKRLITTVLKVPPQPDPPIGSPGTVLVFNAASGFYRYRLAQWGISQAGTLIGLVFGYFFVLDRIQRIQFGPVSFGHTLIQLFEILAIAFFLIQLPVTFLMINLDYRYRWYMITDTSLRIREGLISVRERTMTFANIQNLSVRQGPLQRLFGISDVRVRTAGGGGGEGSGKGQGESSGSANMHLGYFRGVDNADEIRDVILDRLRGLRDSGLGNPDEPAILSPSAPGSTGDRLQTGPAAQASPGAPLQAVSAENRSRLLQAARELLDETRALGAVITS